MKKPISQYSVKNYTQNNYGNLKWTGTFWTVSKKNCQKLNPYSLWFENKKHNCNHKGYPIKLQYTDNTSSEFSFTVTDEKLEQMQQDGRANALLQMGVKAHGGADPLYFDWHNQIAKELKNTSKRTNQKYMELYPYLELPTLSDIDFDTGENALEYLTNKASEFYTGESIPRRHEATLRFISKTSDVTLLENAKNRYISVLEDMEQANNNPTQNNIDKAFRKGIELLGNNPITGTLNFAYDKIQRLVRVMTNINKKELVAIDKRIKKLKPNLKVSPLTPFIPKLKSNTNVKKYVMPTVTALSVFYILKFLGEKIK